MVSKDNIDEGKLCLNTPFWYVSYLLESSSIINL